MDNRERLDDSSVNFRSGGVLVARVYARRGAGTSERTRVMFRKAEGTSLRVFQVRVSWLFGRWPVSSSIIPAIFEYAFVPRDASL